VKFGVHVKAKLQSPTGTPKLYTTPTGFAVVAVEVSDYELDGRDLILDMCVGILSSQPCPKWISSHKKFTMQQQLETFAMSKDG